MEGPLWCNIVRAYNKSVPRRWLQR